jgi:opacity protein-like surface antigen
MNKILIIIITINLFSWLLQLADYMMYKSFNRGNYYSAIDESLHHYSIKKDRYFIKGLFLFDLLSIIALFSLLINLILK